MAERQSRITEVIVGEDSAPVDASTPEVKVDSTPPEEMAVFWADSGPIVEPPEFAKLGAAGQGETLPTTPRINVVIDPNMEVE